MQNVLKTNVKIFTCFSITIVIVVTVLDRVYRNALSLSKLVMYCIYTHVISVNLLVFMNANH